MTDPLFLQALSTIAVALISGICGIIIALVQSSKPKEPREKGASGILVPASFFANAHPNKSSRVQVFGVIFAIIGAFIGYSISTLYFFSHAAPVITETPLPTITAVPISTDTPIYPPLPTSTPTLIQGHDIKENCLAIDLWRPWTLQGNSQSTPQSSAMPSPNSTPYIIPTQNSLGRCWLSSDWGIQPRLGNLILFQENPGEDVIYGFSTHVDSGTTVTLSFTPYQFPVNGNLYFGLTDSEESKVASPFHATGVYARYQSPSRGYISFDVFVVEPTKADYLGRNVVCQNTVDGSCSVKITLEKNIVKLELQMLESYSYCSYWDKNGNCAQYYFGQSLSTFSKEVNISLSKADFWFAYEVPSNDSFLVQISDIEFATEK